jgi:malonyl-CoA O-methyltransferase
VQPRQHFSRAASHYDDHRTVQKDAVSCVIQMAEKWLCSYLKETDLILDIGCGTGALSCLPIPATFIAVDNAEGMCHHALYHYDAMLCADMHYLPFTNSAFSGIVSSLCWQWSDNFSLLIDELYRIMCRGGRAVVTLLTDGTMAELTACYAATSLTPRLLPFIKEKMLFELLEKQHFKLLSYQTITQPYFHPTALDFFRQLKAIGAHHTDSSPPLSNIQLKRLMQHYDMHYHSAEGIQATYVTTGFVIEK